MSRRPKASAQARLEARGEFVALPRSAFVLRSLLWVLIAVLWFSWRGLDDLRSLFAGIEVGSSTLSVTAIEGDAGKQEILPGVMPIMESLTGAVLAVLALGIAVEVAIIAITWAWAPGARKKKRVLRVRAHRSSVLAVVLLGFAVVGIVISSELWTSAWTTPEEAALLYLGLFRSLGAFAFVALIIAASFEGIRARQFWQERVENANRERSS